jgi:two-component system capsular synthesis sensor histidine kinase RcsC
MRILYLEDEPADAQLVERYARFVTHETVIAQTVEEARAALDESPDLILVDILLNRTRQGYGFVSELRAQGYTRPIVAVTGLALPHDIDQCYEAGVTEVLNKPFTVKQLEELLGRYDT